MTTSQIIKVLVCWIFCCLLVTYTRQTDAMSIYDPLANATMRRLIDNVIMSSGQMATESAWHKFYGDEELDSNDDQIDTLRAVQKQPEEMKAWDVLIFTQQWPVTTCYHWREQDKTHECFLPTAKEFWTIHGIWPTQLEHIGPSYCNKSAQFDLRQLDKILDSMQEYWPDLEGTEDFSWLWQHEWLKHGTCAMSLTELDNELKYFGQGLNWRQTYRMSDILDKANIHPDSNNTVITLNNALVKTLGKIPSIHCLYDDKKDISYLAEIRICFNKSLELIDCNGVKLGDATSINYPGGVVHTNCHIGNPVHYPSLVPSTQRKTPDKWVFPVVDMFKLLQFIMWFTL